jgi:RNA polymerase sigma-70 factor (ECF subfamily)
MMLEPPRDGTIEDESGAEPLEFAVFFREEYRKLFHALILACGDRAEAEDIAQDAFVTVFDRWDRVGAMSSPGGYLYAVAFNERRRRARRAALWRRHRQQVELADDASVAAIARADIQRALQQLTREQRDALVLVEFVGLTSEEAAEVLGVAAPAIRSRVHRARLYLREEWSDDA